MKKWIGLAVAVALLAMLPAVANDAKKTERKKEASESSAAGHHASGTITAWDEATKMVTVKNSAGEKSFTWTADTKVTGTPKVGEHVSVEYAKSKDGVISVKGINVGKKKPTSKSEVAKK